MQNPSYPKSIFWQRQAIIDSYRVNRSAKNIYRTPIQPTRPDRDFVCDRCNDDDAQIAGVILMPEADEVQLFCARCFGRTPMLRRVHPEWRFFDVAGPLNMEELAAALASQGLLRGRR